MTFGRGFLNERRDETFTGEMVNIDGYYFRNCRFIGCKLLLTGNEHWGCDSDCTFTNCQILFSGQAQYFLECLTKLFTEQQWSALYQAMRNAPPPIAN